MRRQNFYIGRKRRKARAVDESLAIELVRKERLLQPRLGGRKLLALIGGKLAGHGAAVGRDRFFRLLRSHGMLVERKPGKPRTTNSRHSLPVFRNLVQGMDLSGPNQAWASDITYVRTDEGWMFAALITDLFSRKIVGCHLGESLESVGCVKALEMALKELPEGARPVHHSDRGCQYCCHEYVDMLARNGLPVSMTEAAHCYENATAERVNGILKQEYGLDAKFRTKELARRASAQAVNLYNTRRPHMSIGYQFPDAVHRRGEECAREHASARLRLAPPLALRAAPPGTGVALRSRADRDGAGSEATRGAGAFHFGQTKIENRFEHRKPKKQCVKF